MWILVLLTISGIAAAAIGIERAVVLGRARRSLHRDVSEFLEAGARSLPLRPVGFLPRMLRASLLGGPSFDAEEPARAWSRRLPTLAAIATLAPLLGLSGIVFGTIDELRAIRTPSTTFAGPAGGLGGALVTAAVGWIVGVGSFAAHGVLSTSVSRRLQELKTAHARCMESYGTRVREARQATVVLRRAA